MLWLEGRRQLWLLLLYWHLHCSLRLLWLGRLRHLHLLWLLELHRLLHVLWLLHLGWGLLQHLLWLWRKICLSLCL